MFKKGSNLRLILIVSLFFGLSTGIYEFVLPYYLKHIGVNYVNMGWIYAISAIVVLIARVYMGGLSDILGRKKLYGWALGICGATTMMIPYGTSYVLQILFKTIRDTAGLTRETIHPIVIYEAQKTGFLNLIGKLRGMEFLLQALGTLLTWWIFRTMGGENSGEAYLGNFTLGGGILIAGCIWWLLFFKENWKPEKQKIIPLRELISLDMHPNLILIAISGMIFAVGLQMSHSFYMNLFFTEKFGSKTDFTIWVNIVHRLTLALPLFIVGHFNLKNLKWWYISGVAFQGLTIAISPFLSNSILSASVYLSHDLIGAGIWSPIQATLIQKFSSNEKRGLEVGKVLAWGSIGAIFGPLIAGKLASQSAYLPFLFSGIFIIVAVIPLLFLKLSRDEGANAAA